ncbi:MAG: DUF2892 domain-containing protein [Nitrospira sp.]|nr:DUF2892 domain-containing protein [Nitrospira sp.]
MRRNVNVRRTERWIRIAVGAGLILIGVFAPIPLWAEEIADVIGLLLVVTGGTGYCPLRHVLNRNARAPDGSTHRRGERP